MCRDILHSRLQNQGNQRWDLPRCIKVHICQGASAGCIWSFGLSLPGQWLGHFSRWIMTCEPLQQHTLGGIGIEFLDSWFDTQNAVLNKKTPHGVALKYTLNIGFSAPAMAHGGFLGWSTWMNQHILISLDLWMHKPHLNWVWLTWDLYDSMWLWLNTEAPSWSNFGQELHGLGPNPFAQTPKKHPTEWAPKMTGSTLHGFWAVYSRDGIEWYSLGRWSGDFGCFSHPKVWRIFRCRNPLKKIQVCSDHPQHGTSFVSTWGFLEIFQSSGNNQSWPILDCINKTYLWLAG